MTTRSELDAVSDMALERPAEIDVPDIDELAAMGSEQRIAKLRSMADEVFSAAAIASFLATRDMDAVVDLLIENPRGFGGARLELAKAREEARWFLSIIDLAERHLADGLGTIANRPGAPVDLDVLAVVAQVRRPLGSSGAAA
jgi:hypothetical protein